MLQLLLRRDLELELLVPHGVLAALHVRLGLVLLSADLELEFGVILLCVLDLVAEHITLILDSLHVHFIFANLTTLDHQFSL